MQYITKKSIPRRTFIRGVGATFALPLLDAMVPAATALSKTPAMGPKRLGYVFMPMGCDQSGTGSFAFLSRGLQRFTCATMTVATPTLCG